MILRIAGGLYHAARIDAGEAGTEAVRLTKPDGTAYDLVRTHWGGVECDCAWFEYRLKGTGQTCKHINFAVEAGLISAPMPRRNVPA